MAFVELEWITPSEAECNRIVSPNTLDPSSSEDRNRSEKHESVIVVPHEFAQSPDSEITSTIETTVASSLKICKHKPLDTQESKSSNYGYVGNCNSFGSSSVSTFSTFVSSNPSSADSGSRRIQSISSNEDSTISGFTKGRSYGSFEDSLTSESVYERLASKKMSKTLKLKSLEGNGEKKAGRLTTLCPVHERLARTETVSSAGIKGLKEKKKAICLSSPQGPCFNRHTQGKFSAPERKNSSASRPVRNASRMNESGKFHKKTRLPLGPNSRSFQHSRLRQKMDGLVHTRMKRESHAPTPTRSAQTMESNQQAQQWENGRERHASRTNANSQRYLTPPVRGRSASPHTRVQSGLTTYKFDTTRMHEKHASRRNRNCHRYPSPLIRENSALEDNEPSLMRPTAPTRMQSDSTRSELDTTCMSTSSGVQCDRSRPSPPTPVQSITEINENYQKILPKMLHKILPPRPLSTSCKKSSLFYRLNAQDTYASSKLKSSPTMIIIPRNATPNKIMQKKIADSSVFDRLATTGTAASLWKSANYARYANGYDTFNESVSVALLRNFDRGTYVPVNRGTRIS